MARSIEKVYGHALFEIAAEKNALPAFLEEAVTLKEILETNEELKAFLNYPRISSAEKMQKMEAIFGGNLSADLMGLVQVALTKGRESLLPEILNRFIQEAEQALAIGRVQVAVPFAVSEAQKNAIEAKILSTTSYSTLKVTYTVDPSLIGGMVIRVGDRVVDSSIKSKLNRLTRDLNRIQLT